MGRATLLALLLGGALLAQGLPPRPEQLTFKPLAFETPRTEAFKAKLKNGIPVFIAADPAGIPFVRLKVLIRGGSYLEPRGKEGLANLLGSEWRDGGTLRTSPKGLDERLEIVKAVAPPFRFDRCNDGRPNIAVRSSEGNELIPNIIV